MKDSVSAPKFLFLSDVHLGAFSKARNNGIETELHHLIDFCEKREFQIIILGDLFDYWMEYPNHTPQLGHALLQHFKQYNRSFGRSLFITGNHDNWTNGHFAGLGFDVEKNERILHIDGTEILLLHGDGLDDPSINLPRPLLHRLLRHPTFVAGYQSIFPPKAGLWLMKQFSKLTRSTESHRLQHNRLDIWAKDRLQHSNNEVIICGHDHFPRIKKYPFGTFINLGTFYNDRTIATYNKGQFELVVWSEESQQLQPYQTSLKSDE